MHIIVNLTPVGVKIIYFLVHVIDGLRGATVETLFTRLVEVMQILILAGMLSCCKYSLQQDQNVLNLSGYIWVFKVPHRGRGTIAYLAHL